MLQIVFIDNDDFQFDKPFRTLAKKILYEAENDVRKLLPNLSRNLTFTIFPTKNVIPETGETASAVDKSWIRFSIDPNHHIGLEKIIKNDLRRSFFHEAHHAARFKTEKWGESLISDAIFEGTGTVFERDFSGSTPLWGIYDMSVIKDWTKEYMSLDKSKINKHHWYFEHPDGRKWIAYKVGTYIVDEALKNNPKETAATIVNTPAHTIIEMSKVSEIVK